MADDVTLLPCHCGAEPEVNQEPYMHRVSIWCTSCGEVTRFYDTAPEAYNAWNEARRNEALAAAQEALRTCGIGGIYDDFQDVADAISQMALYIRERDKRIEELEGQAALLTAALANAEGQNPETRTAT